MASGRLAPLLVLAGLLVAGIPHLGSPGEAGSSTPAAPAEEAQTPSRAASSDASVSLEAARSAADWVQDRWQSHRQPLVEETRTARAPVELEAGSWASSWFDEDLVFRPAPGAYVLPGTERVDVTVSWATDPPGTPIDARLLVATAEQAPTEFDEATFRPLESGQTLTIPVEARMWDAPYQEASLWWFAVDLEGEPASAPSEVEVSLEADAVREGPPPSVLSTEIPWWGQDHVPLVEDERRHPRATPPPPPPPPSSRTSAATRSSTAAPASNASCTAPAGARPSPGAPRRRWSPPTRGPSRPR